jgi:hypothetical protein
MRAAADGRDRAALEAAAPASALAARAPLVRGMNASMQWGTLPTVAGAVVALLAILAAPPARAEDTCRSRCWDAYGECYTSTSNRQRCQGQLLRCLSNCIRAKRAPASLESWGACGNAVTAMKRRSLTGMRRL